MVTSCTTLDAIPATVLLRSRSCDHDCRLGRGTEQLSHSFALIDLLPWGRQEEWQDSPEGWPKSPTYSNWLDSPDIARVYGPNGGGR